MKILLTGGHGMVGRNLVDSHLSNLHQLHTPSRSELDLRNKGDVRVYLQQLKPDLIIHAAGRVGGIEANMVHPYEFLLENLELGTNLIATAAEFGVPRLINLASSCIYPKDCSGTLSEGMLLSGPLEPTNEAYALAKISTLKLCEFIRFSARPLHYKTLIPCNLFGPHDKFDLATAHLIPAIITKIQKAKKNKLPTVEVWGNGDARREFMYVGDLVLAIKMAIDNYDSMPNLMNIGVGKDHSVLEYYRAVAEVLQWDGNFTFNTKKPEGMRRKLLSISQQSHWGFTPKHSLIDGISKTNEFYLRSIEASNTDIH